MWDAGILELLGLDMERVIQYFIDSSISRTERAKTLEGLRDGVRGTKALWTL